MGECEKCRDAELIAPGTRQQLSPLMVFNQMISMELIDHLVMNSNSKIAMAEQQGSSRRPKLSRTDVVLAIAWLVRVSNAS